MKRFILALALMCTLTLPLQAEELSLGEKISHVVKVQGTVVGEKIIAAAILDDLIVREGDVVLVDGATGKLVVKLLPKELDSYADDLKITVVSITHGHVIISHAGQIINLAAR